MKRGKNEEKMMGPMFPKVHVNDTDKGEPKGPPRNKMAFYEHVTIPSQRSTNATANLGPPLSQVANFEYVDEAELAEEETPVPPVENKASVNNSERASYWEDVLRDKYEVNKIEEFNAMGKGKRSRKQVLKIDGRTVGDGKVGPVTQILQNAYRNLCAESGVPISTYRHP